MITTTPSTATIALLEGAPAGLTLTARITDGGVLVQTIPNGSITWDDGYAASFTSPATTGTMTFEWLDSATVVGAETLVVSAVVVTEVSTSGTALVRVLANTTATLTTTFYADGAPVDPTPATASITVIRDDGTVLVNAQPATRIGTGRFGYALTSTHTSLLDMLDVHWTSSLGTLVTTVEIVGGFLFTIAQARALSPLNSTTAYPTAAIVEARTMVETALEDACGVAFVPRYRREVIAGSGSVTMMLAPKLRAIRSVTVDGVAVSAGTLTGIRVLPSGLAYNPAGWTWGVANLDVAYEHGYDYPPPRVSQAALLWCKNFLVKGPIDDRMTSMSSEDGTFAISVPGMRGAMVGIPEVDAVIQQYSLAVGVA